jgi:hypothetical protein
MTIVPEIPSLSSFEALKAEVLLDFQELLKVSANEILEGHFEGVINLETISQNERLLEAEKNMLRTIYYFLENLQESRFLLGVLGRFKSGKSTILNALAAYPLSPVDVRVTTGVLAYFAKRTPSACKVFFLNGTEKSLPASELDQYLNDQYNPDNQKRVLYVAHYDPHLELDPNLIYVDTPGLDAVSDVHDAITLEFAQQCSAAIVVSGYPPFGHEELKFYQKIQGSIPHIFLLQNLPPDKFEEWIALECQTLQHLFKMGFYKLDARSEEKVFQRLKLIDQQKNEEDLFKFKAEYDIKLFSVCAKNIQTPSDSSKSQAHFTQFKKSLYQFLSEERGSILLEGYKKKGEQLLKDILKRVNHEQKLLQNSLQELEKAIEDKKKEQERAKEKKEALLNKAKVSFADAFRSFRSRALDEILARTLREILGQYGDINEYRLSKSQKQIILQKLNELHQEIDQLHRTFLQELEKRLKDAQQEVQEHLEQHAHFGLHGPDRSKILTSITLGELVGVHSIDVALDRIVQLLLMIVLANLAGGEGLALVSTLLSLFSIPAASTLGLLIGAGIGLAISFPLLKFLEPLLAPLRGIFAKFFGEKLAEVLPKQVTPSIQLRIDEVERLFVQPLSETFCQEVEENYQKYFELAQKSLETLIQKKKEGREVQELERYKRIQNALHRLEKKFMHHVPTEKTEKKNFWSKVKGLFK